MVVHLISPDGRYDRSTCATTPRCRSRTSWRACRASATCACSARATTHARLARSGEGRRARPHRRRRGARDPRAERAGRRRRGRRTARCRAGRLPAQRRTPRAGCSTEEQFGDIIVKTGANGEVTRLARRRPRRAGRQRLRAALAAGQRARRRAFAIFQAPGSNALELSDARSARRWRS